MQIAITPGAGWQRVAAGLGRAIAGQPARLATTGAQVRAVTLAALLAEMPEKTGTLKANEAVAVTSGNPTIVRLSNATPYHPYVVLGTAPHVIQPVSAQALFWPGAEHPVAIVHHPGTKPNNYAARAAARVEPRLRALLREQGLVLIREITG